MKRLTLLLLVLLAWQMASAHVVTADQARQRAARFFTEAEVRTKSASVSPDEFKLVGTFPEITTKSPAMDPAMYIFERAAGGYAIVSGDDVARPVLGYSLEGRFPISDMPDNMRALLQWYADIIAYAREQGWESFSDEETDSGLDPANSVQLQTARWSQGHPFNDLVPEINGQKPPIGCVATAIGIVMKYHRWPQKGTGTLPSYDYDWDGHYHIDSVVLGHEYDWNKMPDNYEYCSEEEAAQMARLLYDVAVMCEMYFHLGGSSSAVGYAVRLSEYFGYDKQICELTRSKGHSDTEWERLVVDEINASRPVLMGGNSGSGGHAFVLDGYNGRYFSVNFGWGGSSSDFYTLTPIDGHEEDLLAFNRYQRLVCRIMPEGRGGFFEPTVYVSSSSLLPLDFQKGKEFMLSTSVWNPTMNADTLDFQYVLLDGKGNTKEPISSIVRLELPAWGYAFTEDQACIISKPLADGDQIVLLMKSPVSQKWVPVTHNRNGIIVFTNRPLADLMEIGYVEEPHFKVWGEEDKKNDVYFLTYRDVSWILYGKDGSELLSSMGWGMGSQVKWVRDVADSEDPQCDRFLFEIWLPEGTYTLRVRNPMTEEEMEIILEL